MKNILSLSLSLSLSLVAATTAVAAAAVAAGAASSERAPSQKNSSWERIKYRIFGLRRRKKKKNLYCYCCCCCCWEGKGPRKKAGLLTYLHTYISKAAVRIIYTRKIIAKGKVPPGCLSEPGFGIMPLIVCSWSITL